MLSHNINQIDDVKLPAEKQIYSSTMMKNLKRKGIRKTSSSRKIPDNFFNYLILYLEEK